MASESTSARDTKVCLRCGRRIEWRKKWAQHWDEVKWCSQACRSKGVQQLDRQCEHVIREALLHEAGLTITDDVVSQRVSPENPDEVRETVRCAARRLVATGVCELVQGGRVVDPSTARGSFEIRLLR